MHDTRIQTLPSLATALPIPDVEDDTEEAPWMVRGDRQFWAATHLATVLDYYAISHARPWYVGGMLPILYRRPGARRKRQVAPDVLVALVPRRPRDSYDMEEEGVFPAFVLEVVSESSVARDVEQKRRLYEALGAQEYVLFDPDQRLLSPSLQGYRRNAVGRFEVWPPDAQGRLWSAVLGLGLAAEGRMVRAVQTDGRALLTYEELARLRDLLERNGGTGSTE